MVRPGPDEPSAPGAYAALRRSDRHGFSQKLKYLLTERGWNQAELARRTKLHDPRENRPGIGPDMISNYWRGRNLPEPLHLRILADTFGVSPTSLVPSLAASEAPPSVPPPIELKTVGANTAHLRLNLELPMPVAVQILALAQSAVTES